MPELLTVKDISKKLGVSEDTVRKYIHTGVKGVKLTAIDLGRDYRVEEVDLQVFLNRLKTQRENSSSK